MRPAPDLGNANSRERRYCELLERDIYVHESPERAGPKSVGAQKSELAQVIT